MSNLTGIPGAPAATGLPLQPFFRWSDDPIYFLDLGNPTGDAEERDLGAGRKVVLRYFEKGFVAINASTSPQDVTLDLSSDPDLEGPADGVGAYRDHFAGTTIAATSPVFDVPAGWYPLAGVSTHSARVYSYTDSATAVPTASGPGVVALCLLLLAATASATVAATRRTV